MKQSNLLREFARYASLNVFGMIGLSVYILADTFFIAQALGTAGLAALNLAIPIYNVVYGIGVMLGTGGAIAYAVAAGRGRDGAPVLRAVMRIALLIALILMLAGLFCSCPITTLLGADAEVFAMTEIYLRVILLFSPAFILNHILQCAVRNDDNPRLSMLALFGGSMANILFDYIFLYPCNMGIFGAVLATGFSPLVSILILMPHLLRRGRDWFAGKADYAALPRVINLGFPSFLGEISAGVVMIVFNFIMLNLGGNLAVAAYGVIANLAIVTNAVANGVAQGGQPMFSREYGAQRRSNLACLRRYAGITALVLAILLYGVLFFFAAPITELFNGEHDPHLAAMAIPGLRLYFAALPFAALNTFYCAYFAAVERARPAQILSLGRGLLLIIPIACLFSVLWGMTGAWLTYPFTEAVMLIIALCLSLASPHQNKNDKFRPET
ncbi:MAG: MATE family efflux transporter [Clostridia bacterium]|nr:MATE family efflux transporter [Clostridia bacterium]